MLFDINRLEEPIARIPHEAEFNMWRARLAEDQYQAIVDELNLRVSGREVNTASWLPGGNWEGTVFWPIFKIACRENYESSALFFGLIVWKFFMDRDDAWSFGRYEKAGVPIRGLTYFRINV